MGEYSEDLLTGRIITAAISVHRELGSGFQESIYEEAMAIALEETGLRFVRQRPVTVYFHHHIVGIHRPDFFVDESVVVEMKTVAAIDNVHFAIARSYVRASGARCGLLLNFASPTLQVKRVGPEFRPRSQAKV